MYVILTLENGKDKLFWARLRCVTILLTFHPLTLDLATRNHRDSKLKITPKLHNLRIMKLSLKFSEYLQSNVHLLMCEGPEVLKMIEFSILVSHVIC